MATAYGLGYQNVLIHVGRSAPTAAQDDGTWLTTWTLRLREPCDPADAALGRIAADVSRADPFFSATLTARTPRKIEVAVTTHGEGLDAVHWAPTYALLIAVDSAIGRIWTVNAVPRLWYPPFIAAQQQFLSTFAHPGLGVFLAGCVDRAAPFFAASVARPESDETALFRRVADLLGGGASESALAEVFESLAELPEHAYRQEAEVWRDIRREAVTAALAALRADSSESAQWAALCARKTFDAAYLFDELTLGPEPEGLAFAEDDLWWKDAHDLLAADDEGSLAAVRERSARVAAATAAKLADGFGAAPAS